MVDISILWRRDAGTGIQRVVRALSEQMLQSDLGDYRLRFVAATRRKRYRYLEPDQDGKADALRIGKRIFASRGDIFLGLDLSSRLLPRHGRQVRAWRRKGIRICIVVYDILPAQHPEWFNNQQTDYFGRWLHFIGRHADQLLCISKSVAQDLSDWLQQQGYSDPQRTIDICAFPLGGDLRQSRPSHGITDAETQALDNLAGRKVVLMVGTLEPRKGHAIALNAFDRLLRDGLAESPALVIVGRKGWKSEDVQERIRLHPHLNTDIFWFSDASDELLYHLYQRCAGVFFPSFAEGFGLPVVEALSHARPVLTRNIPVFNEISSSLITYFDRDDGVALAQSVTDWLKDIENEQKPCQQDALTWQKSCEALLRHLKILT
ncbi:glycosyltransferase family 4 protein [Sphingobium sp. AR-3-1]|uniref:Glycosyltransferase family 4 protein n=1 Tax=Sphingobium psychrophilum TaxID=2728834 RepID=A0A7X9ZW42_9SPHN|nr:glycosyltransferase family 1 protein [Sphingobium psychrophilum]NML13014.1 glycosyltransferase family 4 protein [Sphingobium psychrophilum]